MSSTSASASRRYTAAEFAAALAALDLLRSAPPASLPRLAPDGTKCTRPRCIKAGRHGYPKADVVVKTPAAHIVVETKTSIGTMPDGRRFRDLTPVEQDAWRTARTARWNAIKAAR